MAEAVVAPAETSASEQLARFFPDLDRVHTRAFLKLSRAGSAHSGEAVLLEFAAAGKAIFCSALPLEFGDRICLASEAGNQVEAKVIAVQFHDGRTVVAAQVLNGQFSWVSRP